MGGITTRFGGLIAAGGTAAEAYNGISSVLSMVAKVGDEVSTVSGRVDMASEKLSLVTSTVTDIPKHVSTISDMSSQPDRVINNILNKYVSTTIP